MKVLHKLFTFVFWRTTSGASSAYSRSQVKFRILFLPFFLLSFLFLSPTTLFAYNADIAVYREATGTENEDSQSVHDEAWDTRVNEDTTEFYLDDVADVLINLTTGGHYFVLTLVKLS